MKIPVFSCFTPRLAAFALLLAASGLTGCGRPQPVVVRQQPQQPMPGEMRRESMPTANNNSVFSESSGGGSQRQKQMEFLNRIRQADPQFKTIDRAVLNQQNELGLILDRSVPMDRLPALMRSMLTQMAKEFPGQDLTVMAYAPSTPPLKIGTAHLDARTRDMSYTAERR